MKLSHNEMLSYPNTYDQIMFGQVSQAWDLGAVGVGTADFGLGHATLLGSQSRLGRRRATWSATMSPTRRRRMHDPR